MIMNNEQFRQLWCANKETHELEARRSVWQMEKALMDIVRIKGMAYQKGNTQSFNKHKEIERIVKFTTRHQEDAYIRLINVD